ncbi:ROK family protein, partial [Paenarthrobacter sp. RAF9]
MPAIRSSSRARLRPPAPVFKDVPWGARRSHMGRRGLAIGIDIGGTKVAAGVVDAEGRVLAEARRSTPGADPRAVEQTIVELVDELSAGHRVASVGIGAAGWMDLDGGTVLFSPHLAWRNEPLRD